MKRIFFILLLALVVRLVGISWGLPAVYHIDESTLVRAAMGMRFGDLNPHFFDWPSLYKYLCYFLFAFFIKLRVPFQIAFGTETMRQLLPFWWGSTAPFYLLARLLTAVFDLGSVFLVFLIGRRLYGRRVGLLAALLMALSAAAVHAVHYNRLEIPTTFFLLASFLVSIDIMEKGRWRDYLLAGLFAGFAASTKYNGALIIVSLVAAHFLRLPKLGPFGHLLRNIEKLLLSGLAAVAGFLLGTPFAVLDWRTFWSKIPEKGFLWQFGHMGHGLNWWKYTYGPFRQDWGILMLLLFLGGVVHILREWRRRSILLLIFPVFYFVYVGSWGIVRGHYLLPLYPFLAVAAAYFFYSFLWPRLGQVASIFVLAACLLVPVSLIVDEDVSGLRGDTRNLARDWVLKNIPPGSRIAIDGSSPPSYLGGILPILPRIEDNPRGYKIFPFEETVETYGRDWDYLERLFSRERIDYYITSDLAHGRLQDLSFYDYLDTKAVLLEEFLPRWYTGPTIKIYKLR